MTSLISFIGSSHASLVAMLQQLGNSICTTAIPPKKKARHEASPLKCDGTELLLGRSLRLVFLLLDERSSLAETLAEIGEFGATHFAVTLDFDLVHAG